ncbi:MAG: hypothetical protein ABI134_31150 [Byssovorax sp.]
MHNLTGKPAEGDDFFDRERETRRLWERIDTDNVLLLAPRRVGKTSLMFRLRDGAEREGFHAAYVSVADVTTEIGFVERLYEAAQKLAPAKKAIRHIAKGPLGRFLRRIKKLGLFSISIELGESAETQWQALGEALSAALDSVDGRWLLLVDELPIFVLTLIRQDPSGARARTFLNWYRQLRIAGKRVRWLLAGSIGLDTVTKRMRFGDTINDLYLFTDFGAFTPEIADQLLDALGKTYDLPLAAEVKAHIRKRTGWLIPFHLQLFFATLREHVSDRRPKSNKITTTDVDAVYEQLLSPAKRAYFDYWEQRLHEELGSPDDRKSIDLIDVIAKNPEGESVATLKSVLGKHFQDGAQRDDKLRYLLDVLQADGYIVETGGRFIFRSSLLRDFWLRRVSL